MPSLKELAADAGLDVCSAEMASHLDKSDPLAFLRAEFHYPKMKHLHGVDHSLVDENEDCIYLCGNSLGLAPKHVEHYVHRELHKWHKQGVLGHRIGETPWEAIDLFAIKGMASLIGAQECEVAVMNTLTVNLNLLMISFYQPSQVRCKVLLESGAFPSDHYAIQSQIRLRGYDPDECMICMKPRNGETFLRTEDILSKIGSEGASIALVLFSGVQYYTGQLFDIATITHAAKQKGCTVGWDLAHAVGNVPLQLHDWNVDFAVWCSYKYLCTGAGGVGGAFIHEQHANDSSRDRLLGWWAHKKESRFVMDNVFLLTNCINNCTNTVSSSVALSACQFTNHDFGRLLCNNAPPRQFLIKSKNVVMVFQCDKRHPDVLRVAPVHLYNSYMDVWRFVNVLLKIQHGMVLLSDGHGKGRPARLELTKDALAIQVAIDVEDGDSVDVNDFEMGTRTVVLHRQKDSGLGLSLKGGTDVAADMPVLISKLANVNFAPDQRANPQLFVGDAISEVNGVSMEGKTHEQVVKALKDAGEQVRLTVRHYTHMAPFLRASDSFKSRSRSSSALPPGGRAQSEMTTGTWKSSMRGTSDMGDGSSVSAASTAAEEAPEGFKLLRKLPLPMAYLTRYLWGTDKLRANAFELRAVDGTPSGVIHCDDQKALKNWLKLLHEHINALNSKSIKLSNKRLHANENITYLGWVCERENEGVDGDLTHRWQPRFLIIKGNEICFFDSPPLESDDLCRCVYAYRIYESLFREVKAADQTDHREQCFILETASPLRKHYFSCEMDNQLRDIESACQRATYQAIQRLQTRTFACNFDGRPSGLTLDIQNGFMLYDIPTKRYLWQYPFSSLGASADDGKMRLRLSFLTGEEDTQESRDVDCTELYAVIYSMYAFYMTRVISIDPDFLKTLKA